MAATVTEIMKFDGKVIGFSHARTWAAMPAALQGVLSPESILEQLRGAHPRVAKSIAALCELGVQRPVRTHDLRNYPNAGLRPVADLRIGPNVTIMAKASCWHVANGEAVIPILQPRLSELSLDKLAIYASLATRAFCRGDWASAKVEIVDLSGPSGSQHAMARIVPQTDLPAIEDERLVAFMRTFVEAQEIVAKLREARPPESPRKPRSDLEQDLFSDDGSPEN